MAEALAGSGAQSGARRTALEPDAWRRLLRRIGLRTRQGQDAEDLLQTAYLRLYERRATTQIENEEGFLVRTAVNLSIDDWRRRRLMGEAIDPDTADAVADPSPQQDEVYAYRVRLDKVRRRIEQMSARTREVFLLHRLEGLKYREIAARLGVSQSAVEKHVAKAVAFLAGAEDE